MLDMEVCQDSKCVINTSYTVRLGQGSPTCWVQATRRNLCFIADTVLIY